MATIRKELLINARPDFVWDALRDFGNVHERLVPGFVLETRVEGDARVVKFFNGLVAKEQLVTLDEKLRRLVYSSVGGRASHHNASVDVIAEADGRTRFVWTTDVLPHELVGPIGEMMGQGAAIIQKTLERAQKEATGTARVA